MKSFLIPVLAASAMLLGACESNGRYNDTARDAAIGGAIGAAGGAVVSGEGDRTRGAVIGGAIGAAAGAIYGCNRDRVCPWSDDNPNHSQLYTDGSNGRRYFIDNQTGDTYWENGEFRSGR